MGIAFGMLSQLLNGVGLTLVSVLCRSMGSFLAVVAPSLGKVNSCCLDTDEFWHHPHLQHNSSFSLWLVSSLLLVSFICRLARVTGAFQSLAFWTQ